MKKHPHKKVSLNPRPHLMRVCIAALTLFATHLPLSAEVVLNKMFGNNMVLQRELPVPVYGKADPGEKVTVTFAGQEKSTTAGSDGKWQVVLDPLETSNNGQTLTVKGTDEKSFKGVLVGEVWLCAGQSNMAGRFGKKSVFFFGIFLPFIVDLVESLHRSR